MPIYEYVCSKDKEHKHVEKRSIHDDQKQQTCVVEGCDGRLNQVITPPPIIFKGGGFHSKRG